MGMRGYSDVLVGLQYGDEGKAKIIDLLAPRYNIVARFNGGANAGHTICTELGLIALMQIPSAIFYPNIDLYIGSGCVLNVSFLIKELDQCQSLGIDLEGRLIVSPHATLVQPHHLLLDALFHKEIGTTGKGIGPCYADRALRMVNGQMRNLQLGYLKEDPAGSISIMRKNLEGVKELYGLPKDAGIEELDFIEQGISRIQSFILDDPHYLQRRVEHGARVLFEGAQSVMLDVARGSVPYVTSGHTVAGYAYAGGDLSPNFHRHNFGIAKAIMSRVGNGSFVSEYGGKDSEEYCDTALSKGLNRETESKEDLLQLLASKESLEVGKGLRILSGEYGTGTKRPRRIGNLDLVQLKNAVSQNAVDFLFLTKTDLLPNYRQTLSKKIPLTVAYRTLSGEHVSYLPTAEKQASNIRAVIEEFDCFDGPINNIREFSALPSELKIILKTIEQATGTKVLGIGVGPMRDEVVVDNKVFDLA